jgi:dihydrofolate reductase
VRKVILGVGLSLDGYIARPDGAVDFLFMPKDFSMGPFFKTIDTAVMGRKTYDVAIKAGGGSFGGRMATFVFSRTLPPGERDGVVFTRQTPESLIGELRRRRGKHIWLMGGGNLSREFLKDDLVDELYLGVVPILIGEGIPAFPAGFPQRGFSLAKNESFSKSLIALTYKRSWSRSGKK